nr:hypothetical protein [Micromonospora sp. DSM 115978]
GNVAGAASTTAVMRGVQLPAPARLVGQVFFLQAVALGGVRRYLAKDRPAVWPKPERQAVASVKDAS